MIAIINIEMGNIGSIYNMLNRLEVKATITANHADILAAERLILPGVGAFDKAMEKLQQLDLINPLNEAVLVRQKPILGICLGMQLFSKRSEEGVLPGLGWIEAETIRFKFDNDHLLRIPHMGWNIVEPSRSHALFEGILQPHRFYFVHSYHVRCQHEQEVLATTHHGFQFTSMVCKSNIIGTQFHPEKSHRYGMKLLQNFVRV